MDKLQFQNTGMAQTPNVFEQNNTQSVRMPLIGTDIGNSKFDSPNFDENQFLYYDQYSPDQRLEHMRANNQSAWSALGRGTANLAISIGTGLLRSGVTAIDWALPGTTLANVSGQPNLLSEGLESITNVAYKFLDGIDEASKSAFKVYESKKYDEAGFLGKALGTQAGLANDVGNGLSFIAQAFIARRFAAGTKVGSAIMQQLGKLGIGVEAMQDVKKAGKLANLAEDWGTSIFSAINESHLEAQGVKDEILKKGEADIVKSFLEGKAPQESWEQLDKRAYHAYVNTAAMNMALLTASNLMDANVVRGSYAEELNKMTAKVLTKGEDALTLSTLKQSLNIGKAGLVGLGKEGLFEENFQTAIQRYEQSYHPNDSKVEAIRGIGKNVIEGVTGLGKAITGGSMTDGEREQAYAAVLGGMLGGPFNMISAHRENKQHNDDVLNASKFSKFLKEKIAPIDDILTEEIAGVYDIKEDGTRTLNEEKLVKYLNNINNKTIDSNIQTYAALDGDKHLHSIVEPMAAVKQGYRLFNNGLDSQVKDLLMEENAFYNAPLTDEHKALGRTKTNKQIIDETFKIFQDTKAESESFERLKPENASATAAFVKQLAYLKSTRNVLAGLNSIQATSGPNAAIDSTLNLAGTVDFIGMYDAAIDELTNNYDEFKRVHNEMKDEGKALDESGKALAAKKEELKATVDPAEKTRLEQEVKAEEKVLTARLFLYDEKNHIKGTEDQALASEKSGVLVEEQHQKSTFKVLGRDWYKGTFNVFSSNRPKTTIQEGDTARFNQDRWAGRVHRTTIPTIEMMKFHAGKDELLKGDVEKLMPDSLFDELNDAIADITNSITIVSVPATLIGAHQVGDNPTQRAMDAADMAIAAGIEITKKLQAYGSIFTDALFNTKYKQFVNTFNELTTKLKEYEDALLNAQTDIDTKITAGTNTPVDNRAKNLILNLLNGLFNPVYYMEQVGANLEEGLHLLKEQEYTNSIDALSNLDVLSFDYADKYLRHVIKSIDLKAGADLDLLIDRLETLKEYYATRTDVRDTFKDKIDKLFDLAIEEAKKQKLKAGQETGVRERIQSLLNSGIIDFVRRVGVNIPPEVTTIKGLSALIATLPDAQKSALFAATSLGTINNNLLFEASFISAVAKVKRHELTPDIDAILSNRPLNARQIELAKIDHNILKLLKTDSYSEQVRDSLPFLAALQVNPSILDALLPYKEDGITEAQFRNSFDAALDGLYKGIYLDLLQIDPVLLKAYVEHNVDNYSITAQQQLSEISILKEISLRDKNTPYSDVLIQGLAGAGKTHTTKSIINSLISSGVPVMYTTFSQGEDSVVREFTGKTNFKSTPYTSILTALNGLPNKSGILVIDEAYLMTGTELEDIRLAARAKNIPIVYAGDITQNKNNNVLSDSDSRENNGIKLAPTLSVSYRTGHPGIAKLYGGYYMTDAIVGENVAVSNVAVTPAVFNKDTRGSIVTRTAQDIVDLVKIDTQRSKLIIVGNSAQRQFYINQGIDPNIVKLWNEIQGMEREEVYVDFNMEDVVGIGNPANHTAFNRAMYTALSRAQHFSVLVQTDTNVNIINLPSQEVNIPSYEDEFKKLKEDYKQGVKEASDILGNPVPVTLATAPVVTPAAAPATGTPGTTGTGGTTGTPPAGTPPSTPPSGTTGPVVTPTTPTVTPTAPTGTPAAEPEVVTEETPTEESIVVTETPVEPVIETKEEVIETPPVAKDEDLTDKEVRTDKIVDTEDETAMTDEEIDLLNDTNNDSIPISDTVNPGTQVVTFPTNTYNLGKSFTGTPIIVRFDGSGPGQFIYKVFARRPNSNDLTTNLEEVGVLGAKEISALGPYLPQVSMNETNFNTSMDTKVLNAIIEKNNKNLASASVAQLDNHTLYYSPFKHSRSKEAKLAIADNQWVEGYIDNFIASYNKAHPENIYTDKDGKRVSNGQGITRADIKVGIKIFLYNDKYFKRYENSTHIKLGVPYISISIKGKDKNGKPTFKKPFVFELKNTKYGNDTTFFKGKFEFFNENYNWPYVSHAAAKYLRTQRIPKGIKLDTNTKIFSSDGTIADNEGLVKFLNTYVNVTNKIVEVPESVKDRLLDSTTNDRDSYTNAMHLAMDAIIESLANNPIIKKLGIVDSFVGQNLTLPQLMNVIEKRQMEGRDPKDKSDLIGIHFVKNTEGKNSHYKLAVGLNSGAYLSIFPATLNSKFDDLETSFRQVAASNKSIGGYSTRNDAETDRNSKLDLGLSIKSLLPRLDFRSLMYILRSKSPMAMKMFVFSSNKSVKYNIEIEKNGETVIGNGFDEYSKRVKWFRKMLYATATKKMKANKGLYAEELEVMNKGSKGSYEDMWKDLKSFEFDSYHIAKGDNYESAVAKLDNIYDMLTATHATFNPISKKFVFSNHAINEKSFLLQFTHEGNTYDTFMDFSDMFSQYENDIHQVFNTLIDLEDGDLNNSMDWNGLKALNDRATTSELYRHAPVDSHNHMGDDELIDMINSGDIDIESPDLMELLQKNFAPTTADDGLQFPVVQIHPKGGAISATPEIQKNTANKSLIDLLDKHFANPVTKSETLLKLMTIPGFAEELKIICK